MLVKARKNLSRSWNTLGVGPNLEMILNQDEGNTGKEELLNDGSDNCFPSSLSGILMNIQEFRFFIRIVRSLSFHSRIYIDHYCFYRFDHFRLTQEYKLLRSVLKIVRAFIYKGCKIGPDKVWEGRIDSLKILSIGPLRTSELISRQLYL